MVIAPTPEPKAWHNMTCSPVKRLVRLILEAASVFATIALVVWAVIIFPWAFVISACIVAFSYGMAWLMEDDACNDEGAT